MRVRSKISRLHRRKPQHRARREEHHVHVDRDESGRRRMLRSRPFRERADLLFSRQNSASKSPRFDRRRRRHVPLRDARHLLRHGATT